MPAHKPPSSSCSSISATRPNPNARNSESKDPMRRSFSGNPFARPSLVVANSRGGANPNTPANSPSDPRRSSIGRENFSLGDSEDKENSKSSSLRPERVQSPASALKGTKNFMSPTISAASKFNPSPRKKILVERNELRTSGSFSDTKSQVMMEDNNVKPGISSIKKKNVSFSDATTMLMEDDLSKPELDLNQRKIEVSHDQIVSNMDHCEAPKSDRHFDSQVPLYVSSLWETVTKNDCVNLDPTFKISPRSSPPSPMLAPPDANPVMPQRSTTSPLLAPLDADPVMPPRSTPSPPILEPLDADPVMPSSSASSLMLAPLDADPVMPPYDPKTNYLSPRPQFLHYKPNRRVELILNECRDGKRLESFILENLSDSEVSEHLSEDSRKETDADSSGEMVNEEEGEEEEDPSVYEPVPISTHKSKESVQAKWVSKSKFLTRSKFIALFLVLTFGCLAISVTDSPVSNLSVLNELSYYDLYVPPEIIVSAKVHFEVLAQKSRLWAANSFSYICKLISQSVVHKLGPLQYGNLTALLKEDSLVDGYLKFGHRDAVTDFKYEENVLTTLRERYVEVESLEDGHQEIEADDNDNEDLEEENSAGFVEQVPEDVEVHDNINEAIEENSTGFEDQLPDDVEVHDNSIESEDIFTPTAVMIEPANLVAEQSEEATVEADAKNDIKPSRTIDVTDQPVVVSEVTEIQPDIEASETQEENDLNSCAEIESTRAEDIPQMTEMDASVVNPQRLATLDKFLTMHVVAISSLVLLTLLTATAFFNSAKKGKLSTQNATTPLQQSVTTKKLDCSPISVATEHTFQEKLTSRNWQTQDDMYGEPCPSEMSSFKSSSNSKKGLKAKSSEAQSQETKPRRNYRRESLASSDFSLGSASYGSFTTYEKIPSKHGHSEDEVVTPVRRSSRIRNLVTSP